jgi:very-short-patch-repair endonuclease
MKWSDIPAGQVTYLDGAPTEAIEMALEPLPDEAPLVVTYYAPAGHSRTALVESILSQLEAGAIKLFPAWLPTAADLEGPGGAGVAAVRLLAKRQAAETHHFGPFLADLAEQALRGGHHSTAKFAPEVRAAELSKILAASYSRASAAILIDVPAGLDPSAERVLGAVSEWFAAQGNFSVWLAGHRLATAERISAIHVDLPPHVQQIIKVPPPPQAPPTERNLVVFPPLLGEPRWNSRAENLLESELRKLSWAAGRIWNRPYKLLPQYIIDLTWLHDWCAIEIDGDEHRNPYHFERDHRRDVDLQTHGFHVLRFTNNEVLQDIADVIHRIEQFLLVKRARPQEGPK